MKTNLANLLSEQLPAHLIQHKFSEFVLQSPNVPAFIDVDNSIENELSNAANL